jgi:hypothetical protein
VKSAVVPLMSVSVFVHTAANLLAASAAWALTRSRAAETPQLLTIVMRIREEDVDEGS